MPSRVGDALLQKRQSIHYTTLPTDNIVPPVPSIPPVPSQNNAPNSRHPHPSSPSSSSAAPYNQQHSAAAATGHSSGLTTDPSIFQHEKFDAEAFVNQRLKGSTPATQHEDLRKLKDELNRALNLNSSSLQKSVLQNYADFVKISKDVSTLENEVVDLKGALEDWRGVPASLEIVSGQGDDISGGTGPGGISNRRAQRNSIADVAALYKSQLEALWDSIEGSQKFLPPVPNRHVVAESSTFIQIDSATYRPRRPVHIVLLNDTILIAVKKRRQMGAKERLVAERCFNLNEILVVDLKDGSSLTNAIKVSHGRESIIFRTEKAADKKMLLVAFKKIAEETMRKKRNENALEAQSHWGSVRAEGLPDGSGRTRYEPNPSAWIKPCKVLGLDREDDPTGRDINWIDDLSSQLSVYIATRDFDKAVQLIEKGRFLSDEYVGSPLTVSLLGTTLNAHSSNLASTLLTTLSSPWCTKSLIVDYANLLLRLDQGEAARESFLSGRRSVLEKRSQKIVYENNLPDYVSELAQVYFTGIKNTCEWYMAAFKDARMASGFVRWASEQMENFAVMFRAKAWEKDVQNRTPQDDAMVHECWEITKLHSKVVKDVGLDFSFILDGLLVPPEAVDQRGNDNGTDNEHTS